MFLTVEILGKVGGPVGEPGLLAGLATASAPFGKLSLVVASASVASTSPPPGTPFKGFPQIFRYLRLGVQLLNSRKHVIGSVILCQLVYVPSPRV